MSLPVSIERFTPQFQRRAVFQISYTQDMATQSDKDTVLSERSKKNKSKRSRKRNREESKSVSNHEAQHSPPAKKQHTESKHYRSSEATGNADPEKNKVVAAVQAFVANEHAKLKRDLQKARKKMYAQKAKKKRQKQAQRQKASTSKEAPDGEEKAGEDHAEIAKRARTLERHTKRTRHDMDRANMDDMICTKPHEFLWKEYVKWTREKNVATAVSKPWSKDQVVGVTEDGEESFIPHVQAAIGANYKTKTGFRKSKKAVPGVAVIALAGSAKRAVKIAPRFYDGQSVGKLFGKHIQSEEQQQWLRRACRKGVIATAAGTARRVHRLVEDGQMTLKHTLLVVLDFARDERLRNMFDFPPVRDEVLHFLHECGVERMKKGMKVMLTIPKAQPIRLSDVVTKGDKSEGGHA